VLRNLLTQTCTILRWTDSGDDQYGSDVATYVDTSSQLWPCKLDHTSSDEVESDRTTRTSLYTLWLGDDAAGEIDALSRVVVGGVTYQVVGEPLTHFRRARVSHVEATLRFIEG